MYKSSIPQFATDQIFTTIAISCENNYPVKIIGYISNSLQEVVEVIKALTYFPDGDPSTHSLGQV